MIDQTVLNFLVKLSLSCLLLSLAIFENVDCKAIQNEQYNGEVQAAQAVPGQLYQYQHQQPQQPEQTPYNYQASAVSSPANNYQYYEQQQQQQQQNQIAQVPHYQNYEHLETNTNTSNNKPHRRSILSSLMAPFYSMRDQGMSMLSASLQRCDPNRFSMWCRFWSMFIRR